jgi:iron complex transport system substrate-binding protein
MAYRSRIVCLSEETTETLYLLGQEHCIVGISGYIVRAVARMPATLRRAS